MRKRRKPHDPATNLSQVYTLKFLPGEKYALSRWSQLLKDWLRVATFDKSELSLYLAYYLPISMKSTEYVLKMILDIEEVKTTTTTLRTRKSTRIQILIHYDDKGSSEDKKGVDPTTLE